MIAAPLLSNFIFLLAGSPGPSYPQDPEFRSAPRLGVNKVADWLLYLHYGLRLMECDGGQNEILNHLIEGGD
ncbi:hypothetical protein CMK14_14155 [Candidatus Poribacteria bacterium]|nr:hypothetical protein [Candidatus Poribacteria bacterium]